MFTFCISSRSQTTSAEEVLTARAVVSDQADVKTIAECILARLKLDTNVVTLKALRLLEKLLNLASSEGANDLILTATSVCKHQVADLCSFDRVDPVGCPENPEKPAALIRRAATQVTKLMDDPNSCPDDLSALRSSMLRGTFMMADSTQRTRDRASREQIDMYLRLVMDSLGMIQTVQDEKCDQMDVGAKWEMIKANAETVNFDSAFVQAKFDPPTRGGAAMQRRA